MKLSPEELEALGKSISAMSPPELEAYISAAEPELARVIGSGMALNIRELREKHLVSVLDAVTNVICSTFGAHTKRTTSLLKPLFVLTKECGTGSVGKPLDDLDFKRFTSALMRLSKVMPSPDARRMLAAFTKEGTKLQTKINFFESFTQ